MSPDMRRLALAVAKVRWHDPETRDEDWPDEALANFECEAIVRAVLTELREVSPSMAYAGGDEVTEDPDGPFGFVPIGSRAAASAFAAILNHILAEPATA